MTFRKRLWKIKDLPDEAVHALSPAATSAL
jgi:hypothetical protein